MTDAAGNTSFGITTEYDATTGIAVFTADKNWLDSEERVYPVRIDPGTTLVSSEVITIYSVSKGDNGFGWNSVA